MQRPRGPCGAEITKHAGRNRHVHGGKSINAPPSAGTDHAHVGVDARVAEVETDLQDDAVALDELQESEVAPVVREQ